MAGQARATKPTGGDRTLAALCYLILSLAVLLVRTLGLTFTLALFIWIIFALICYFAGRKRLFVRFHFIQSQIFSVLLFIVLIIVDITINKSVVYGAALFYLLNTIFLTYLGLTLLYTILAGAGKRAHIPFIGGLADKYANRQPKEARKIS